jgi:hypothetical protein
MDLSVRILLFANLHFKVTPLQAAAVQPSRLLEPLIRLQLFVRQ